MRCAERVIRAFRPLGEAAEPVLHAQGADTVASPGQDLVRIALVPDVPDQLVARRVKHGVNRHGKFNHAQPRAQMAAGFRHRRNRLCPHFVSQLL
ncbi:hypothetical protein GALL_472000 [mine drainage metagenome]|uniref:Uncharacterized protein n=1 Tax=mine drainage metagenome TaxID=410659 RepID=A0A1J5Q118_9ZZZZ